MNNTVISDRISKMWKASREASGKSQDYVARSLGVSKKTVQNWEAGIAYPNFRVAIEWFDCLGVPMYPYLMSVIYPELFDEISAESDMSDIRTALSKYIDELDDQHIRELLFILYGSHGSSPTGTLDLITAYLHLPMAIRVCIAENILTNYEVACAVGLLKSNDHVLPKTETLQKCVDSAKSAVLMGKETYTILETE